MINNNICLLILCSFKSYLEGNKKSKSAEEFLIEKKKPLKPQSEFNKLPKFKISLLSYLKKLILMN